MNTLKLDTELYSRLWSHLLPKGSKIEQLAFLFCKTTTLDGGVVFEPVDDWLLDGAEYFAAQHIDHLELSDEARIRVIKHAHVLGASLVELHSHPGPWPAAFSLYDKAGLEETVPHMRWRLRNRPYLAIVVAPSGFDALVWPRNARVPEPLAGIDLDDRILRPTNASLEGWSEGKNNDWKSL